MSEGYTSSPLDQALTALERNRDEIDKHNAALKKLDAERRELVSRVKEAFQQQAARANFQMTLVDGIAEDIKP